MDVISLSPLRTGSLVWQPRRGSWVLTAVCKATYSLVPSEAVLAPEQEYPNEDDNHWNDDPARSVYSPSDLVPFKPRADVTLVGHAFAPRKEPVRSVIARLLVGEVDKAVEVWADRSFTADGNLREGQRFARMPLRWERAAGGPDTANPVGVRLDARPDAYGAAPLPNLQPPGLLVASPKDFVEPICFGPIAWTWPERRARLGRHAATWSPSSWSQQPMPEDIDPGFFNAAPRDQQVDALRPDERIVLENLHPDHPRLVTNLPGIAPRAFVERRGAVPQEVQFVGDTLWIDTDRGICTLTWRAQIPIDHPAQPGRVLIAMNEPGQRLTWADVERLAGAQQPSESTELTATTLPRPDSEPLARGTESAPAAPPPPPPQPQRSLTLPFVQKTPPEPQRPRRDPLTETHDSTALAGSALPFGVAPPAAAPPPPVRRPEGAADASPPWLTQGRAALAGPPAPPPVPAPAAPPPPVRPNSIPPGSPFGSPPLGYPPPPVPLAPAPPPPAPPPPAPPPATPPPATPPPPAAPVFGPAPPLAPPPIKLAAPTLGAVAPAPAPARAIAARSREIVDLLWFDTAALPRIRAEHKLEPQRAPGPPDLADRRDVTAVLARGEPMDPDRLSDAIADAAGEDGAFIPPLVLTAGEIALPFDEIAQLEATVHAATPFIGADKELADAVESARELLEGGSLGGSPGLAEGLSTRIREAFLRTSRAVPPSFLDTQSERALLERRRYQKRDVFGETCVRALLAPGSVPVYLPEALGRRLPLFPRLRARILAEAHLAQDQYETHPAALKVVALARVMPLKR